MGLSIQVSSRLSSPSCKVNDPSRIPPLCLLEESNSSGAPAAVTQDSVHSGGEGLKFMEAAACMRDPVEDLHIVDHSTGNGTGTKGTAICDRTGKPLKLVTSREFV